jgi:hypothetical protein
MTATPSRSTGRDLYCLPDPASLTSFGFVQDPPSSGNDAPPGRLISIQLKGFAMTELPRRELLTKGVAALAGAAVVAATGSAMAAPSAAKPLKRFVIEREVPGIGLSTAQQFCDIAQTSDNALAQLAPHIQWQLSYVADNKTFCVYLAEDEDAIMQHSKLSGFPANKITLIDTIIDPTTALVKPA